MTEQKYYTLMTELGIQKLVRAQANGTTIKLTEMAVGTSNRAPVGSYTKLENEVWRGPINEMKVDPTNPNWVVAESHIPADVGGWMVREVGLFDTDGDLIVIGRQPDTYKPILSDGTAKELIIKLIMEVSNTACIELQINPDVVMASRAYVDGRQNEMENRMTAFEKKVIGMIEAQDLKVDMLARGLQRVMIMMELDGKVQGGYGFFDDFSGTPKAIHLDVTQTIVEANLKAGTVAIMVNHKFKVGQEVSIFDNEQQEDTIITKAEVGKIEVKPLKNNYKRGAVITRSTVTRNQIPISFNMNSIQSEVI